MPGVLVCANYSVAIFDPCGSLAFITCIFADVAVLNIASDGGWWLFHA